MTYKETLEWLFTQTPMFSREGNSAYKPGLDTITRLCEAFGSPQKQLRCIHVAGTNGKGSTASSLAAIMQSAGLKTGLYTSPHLVDFRERIRIDGRMVTEQFVVSFVEQYLSKNLPLHPSFFELTTAMAFTWFALNEVDIAIIEVGLGGRLDSTNIITPQASVITNISLDHTSLLGNTIAEIAAEKAGIIKPGVPVFIGPGNDLAAVDVFRRKAAEAGAPIRFATPAEASSAPNGGWHYSYKGLTINSPLGGEFQRMNMSVVLAVMERFAYIPPEAVKAGMERVCELTGLRGRMTRIPLPDNKLLIYDTGHNPGAWAYISRQLAALQPLSMVVGFAADKDVDAIVAMMPRHANYHFVRPAGHRGMEAEELRAIARRHGIDGECHTSLDEAIKQAIGRTPSGGTIFVGGSNYLIEMLPVSLYAPSPSSC